MNNNIKATLLPNSEVPLQPGLQDHTWFRGFDFNTTGIRFAQATNENGVICYVRFVTTDDVILITDFSVNSQATTEEVKQAGDAIDLLLEDEANIAGVSRLLLIKPGSSECIEVRTYTQRITHLPKLSTPSHVAYIN
jgi:hypothetical protein